MKVSRRWLIIVQEHNPSARASIHIPGSLLPSDHLAETRELPGKCECSMPFHSGSWTTSPALYTAITRHRDTYNRDIREGAMKLIYNDAN